MISPAYLASVQTVTGELLANWWRADNLRVNAVARYQDKVYEGGNFRTIGPEEPNGSLFNIFIGAPNLSYLNPNGEVLTIMPDGHRGWFIGGAFTEVGALKRSYAAHINLESIDEEGLFSKAILMFNFFKRI